MPNLGNGLFVLVLWYRLFHHKGKQNLLSGKHLSFCTTVKSGLPYISWSICTVKSHSILYFSHSIHYSLACVFATFCSLLLHIFYIFPNWSLFQTSHVVFYTPFWANLPDSLVTWFTLSSGFQHILHLRFSWVLSIIAFMLLGRIACSYAATIKVSVVLFKHPFLIRPHQSSLILPFISLINCPCNCFYVHCVFPSFFFPFLYSFVFFYLHLFLLYVQQLAIFFCCFLHNPLNPNCCPHCLHFLIDTTSQIAFQCPR